MRVAIYRVLYGEDFIQESIRSILPHVDQVVVAMARRPWGSSKGVTYEGAWVPWPDRFDETRDKLSALAEPRVEVIEDTWPMPANQHQHLVNDRVSPKYRPEEVVLIEPDHVFHEDQAERAFSEWNVTSIWRTRQASTRMIELWRSPAWRIAQRHRPSVMFHRLFGHPMRQTSGDGGQAGQSTFWLKAEVHNLGFCFSEKVMRWKHLTALAFSDEIGDAPPDPAWLARWLAWKPGDRDLEVSLGGQHTISEAVPYDLNALPARIRARYDAGEWRHLP